MRQSVFIRAYLRASTEDQDANRARGALEEFVAQNDVKIASWYVENQSGATACRPEIRRLLQDAHHGDIILVESIDRLSRLNRQDWKTLRAELNTKGLRIVALDIPTSYMAFTGSSLDDFTSRLLDSVNDMLLDALAAIARKDYEDRRRQQMQGVEKAKFAGKYKGRPKNVELRRNISKLLSSSVSEGRKYSVREIAKLLNCSTNTVQSVNKHGV